MSVTVDIDELRVGMFVHLDLGWWAHPFALSSFQLQSTDQIATIRGLGLKQVRWSPEKSQLNDLPTPSQWDTGVVGTAASQTDPTTDAAASAPSLQATGATDEAAPATPPATAAANPLDVQTAALRQCEAQYREAGSACRLAFDQVLDDTATAGATAAGLTRALLDKMLIDGEMCVRTLNEPLGDLMAGHALNVTVVSLLLGRVFGFSADEMLALGQGALLHDMGKLELPERARHAELLQTGSEEALYRDHVAHGVALGQRMALPEAAMQVLAQHHEMADGTGFPQRLGLDRMTICARIVSLVNRYDNLCNPLQPAQAMTPHEALSLLFAQCKNKFDATMLNAFIRMMGVYPPGSVVQLTDDRYASVVSVNSSRPLKPRVMVCDPSVPADEALLLELDRHPDLGIRRSLKPGHLPAAVRDYLSPRPRMVYFFEPATAGLVQPAEALAA